MKATVWNDTLQMTIVVVFFVALIVLGTSEVGGISAVFRIAANGDRLRFDKAET